MRSLALLLLLLPGCQGVALQPHVAGDDQTPWPDGQRFVVTYDADSVYYALNFNPDPAAVYGRQPGNWCFWSGLIFEYPNGNRMAIWEAYGEADSVRVFAYFDYAEAHTVGRVPLVLRASALRFSIPRAWGEDPPTHVPVASHMSVFGFNPGGSEKPGLFHETIPRRLVEVIAGDP